MSIIADHYVSVGRNCEVAFQFRRVLGFDESNFFNWNVTPLESLIALIRHDFSRIDKADHWTCDGHPHLLRDTFYNFGFHWVGGNALEFRYSPELIEEQRKKNVYLANKFRTLMRDDSMKILFHITQESDAKNKLIEARDALVDYGSKNFHIVAIQSRDRYDDDWSEDHLSNRYVARIAPDEDATDGHIDSWDAIFFEFPHRLPLRLAWRHAPEAVDKAEVEKFDVEEKSSPMRKWAKMLRIPMKL